MHKWWQRVTRRFRRCPPFWFHHRHRKLKREMVKPAPTEHCKEPEEYLHLWWEERCCRCGNVKKLIPPTRRSAGF